MIQCRTQVSYFAHQKLWYIVYEKGNAAYPTNKDISLKVVSTFLVSRLYYSESFVRRDSLGLAAVV
jgi:hypothetical protein